MEAVPPAIARAIVLRHLPRPLRAGLDPRAGEGPLPAELAADAEAISGGLGAEVAAWIRAHVGEAAGLSRWPAEEAAHPEARPATPTGGGIDALDRDAAVLDDPNLREIADALLLLGRFDALAPLAGRTAAAAWSYLERLPETGAILHQLALASGTAQSGHGSVDVPWPDLGSDGWPKGIPDLPGEAAGDAWRAAVDEAFAALRGEARLLALGLSAIAAGRAAPTWQLDSLGQVALGVGRGIVEPLELAASREGRRYEEERASAEIAKLRKKIRDHEAAAAPPEATFAADVPAGHVLVCPALARTGPGKGKDIARGYEHAIGTALPLVPTPDVVAARRALVAEFPYAAGAVDAALGAFSGRPHVHAPPLLVAGPPGAGKSRFVRRLGEALGVGVYRVDGANDGGASFGGTERRWYSSEPCRPFMAVARHSQANPVVLVDEVDKAPTRSDYGRLWDAMLPALDPENAARFPDPSLQVELDLSWVTIICTANDPSALPMPLLDRMRVVRFPEPRPEHLDALLPGVLAAVAAEAAMDPRFVPALDGIERAALRARWRGGSVRRLRRAVEAVLRVRDRTLAGRPQ